jgi:hypothetical protein
MSYSCIDGYETLMGVAQELPHYDHDAESELDDDDVSGIVDLALEAFEREAQQKAAITAAARVMLAALEKLIAWDNDDKTDAGDLDWERISSIIVSAREAIAAAKAAGIEPKEA